MPTKVRLLLAPIAAVLFLSACSVSVFIGALTDKNVSTSEYTGALLADAPIADTATLDAGEQRIYKIDITSSSLPALFLYMDRELDLYVYDANGSIVATSATADFFAASYGGLSSVSTAATLEPAIVFQQSCPGSCVIQTSNAVSPIFVRVENPTSAAVTYDFHAVTREFADSSESSSSPTPIPTAADGGFAEGAIETLGDVDTFTATDTGVLYFGPFVDLPSGLTFEAEITDPNDPLQDPIYLSNGNSTTILSGELVRVYAVNSPSRAAVSGNSSYSLDIDDN